MTEEQIKHLRDRFLGWRLPEAFKPDNGISYTAPHGCWSSPPTGTNLFNAEQADAMVRYMILNMPDGNATKVGGAIYEETCKIAQDDEASGTLTLHNIRFERLGRAAIEAMK